MSVWEEIGLSLPDDERVWELYHENSKTHRLSGGLADAEAVEVMLRLYEDLPYPGSETVALGALELPAIELGEAILARRTALAFGERRLTLAELAALLQAGYGTVQRPSAIGERRFRTVPSGGALYPLELYVYANAVDGLDGGLYHFQATRRVLQRLEPAPSPDEVVALFVQPELIAAASAVILMTAVFHRTTFKYGERGYRFAMLEAGHAGQNVCLAATALRCAAAPLGGFFDREVEALLAIDGVEHSMLYAIAVGSPALA
jgi:SagB-type dehydrogenase family enzyme